MQASLSGPHGASLATTAGITAVITGVLAGGLLAQCPAIPGTAGVLASLAGAALALAAGLLYVARNAIGLALDHAGDPPLAAYWAGRGLRTYHAGMAALFLGMALAIAWRLGLVQGAWGWLGTAIAGVMAVRAAGRAFRQGP
jgi:hypothetical protein